jgi:tetratricopeptide (TPR) repeat protein
MTAASHRSAPDKARDRREHFRAGLRAMNHELLEEARDHLAAAASPAGLEAADPTAIDALAYLSSVAFALGDVEFAGEAVERALAVGSRRFATNQKAGEFAMRMGDPERAATHFLAALRASEPGTAQARAAEVSLREARGRLAGGVKHGASLPTRGGLAARLAVWRRPKATPLQAQPRRTQTRQTQPQA